MILVSGGFDPIHRGHIALLRAAALHGPVVVILNSDEWLAKKKGSGFQSWQDRAIILQAIRYVTRVVPVDDSDGTVCAALRELAGEGDIFANGGDRTAENTPEAKLCETLGVQLLWRVGGDKVESSTKLLQRWARESSTCLCGHAHHLHDYMKGCRAFMGRGLICDCEDFVAQTRMG